MAGTRRNRKPQVGTISSTIADRLPMTIVCDAMGCHNRKTFDLEALSRKLGPVFLPKTLSGRDFYPANVRLGHIGDVGLPGTLSD